jgi:hypothetical protein
MITAAEGLTSLLLAIGALALVTRLRASAFRPGEQTEIVNAARLVDNFWSN